MDANELKQKLPIPFVLTHYGASFRTDSRGQVWFSVRNEKHPSCKAVLGDRCWVWRDYGDAGPGTEGTVLDLIWRLEGHTGRPALSECLRIAQGILGEVNPCVSPQKPSREPARASDVKILKDLPVTDLKSKALKDALWRERRLVVCDLAPLDVRLVKFQYRSNGKPHWKLGIKNIRDGWELFDPNKSQNGGWKFTAGEKAISFHALDNRDSGVIYLAESVFDLAAVRKLEPDARNAVGVSLNSVNLVMQFVNLAELQADKINKIVLALDNDGPGKTTADTIEEKLGHLVDVRRFLYTGKDPGEAWHRQARKETIHAP